MKDFVIQAENVSMEFRMSSEKIDNLKEFFIKKVKGQISYHTLWALKNVNFQMKKGESVAIIGLNGSGKSTFLKILSGILRPTIGRVKIKGKVAPLIELGAGFDMDLTAKENVWLNGAILGYSRNEMRKHYDEIVEFAELHEFMDTPLKNFSSGMLARLAFSVMTIGSPNILIVDEVLSVGDFTFQEKCKKRIREMQARGTSILFVSHGMAQIEEICDRAVWLEKGMVKMDGPTHEVTRAYLKSGGKEETEEEIQFDIVVPLHKTPRSYLADLIHSVKNQTYENWRLYLSDGSGAHSPLQEILEEYEANDERIKVIQNNCELHISENTNRALHVAEGDYVVFLDHDDTLDPEALMECVKAIRNHPHVQLIYTDSDKLTEDGTQYCQPCRKPDFNLELFRSYDFMCHLSVVKKELRKKIGYLNPKYDGAEDYDFLLRCIEETEQIVHIPQILYHWRMSPDSIATSTENKPYAYLAGKRAMCDHYKRMGFDVEMEYTKYGSLRPIFELEEHPLVSVILLGSSEKKPIESYKVYLQAASSYMNFEVIQDDWKQAKGEYFIFLHDCTKLENPDSFRELLWYGMRSDVGAVGSRILSSDHRILHAGIEVKEDGTGEYRYRGLEDENPEYYVQTMYARECEAVSIEGMMIRRELFSEVEEDFSDEVKLCRQIQKKGFRIIYQPYSVFRRED